MIRRSFGENISSGLGEGLRVLRRCAFILSSRDNAYRITGPDSSLDWPLLPGSEAERRPIRLLAAGCRRICWARWYIVLAIGRS